MKLFRRRPYRPAARSVGASHTPMTPEARRDFDAVAARCWEWIGPDRDRFAYREPAHYCAVFDLELLVPCEHMVERGAATLVRAHQLGGQQCAANSPGGYLSKVSQEIRTKLVSRSVPPGLMRHRLPRGHGRRHG